MDNRHFKTKISRSFHFYSFLVCDKIAKICNPIKDKNIRKSQWKTFCFLAKQSLTEWGMPLQWGHWQINSITKNTSSWKLINHWYWHILKTYSSLYQKNNNSYYSNNTTKLVGLTGLKSVWCTITILVWLCASRS